MQLARISLGWIAATLAAAPVFAGEIISDQGRGFHLSVPDGFVRQGPERLQGKAIYAFQRLPAADEKMPTFIVITRLGGVLDREKFDPQEVAAKSSTVTLSTEKWKEFDIEVFRVPEQAGELQIVTFNAQVPLKPEAIQIAVIGDASRESELRGVLRSVLRSLDGPTNWLSRGDRMTRSVEGIIRLSVTIGVVAVVVVSVWRGIRKRKASGGAAEQVSSPQNPESNE